MKVANTAETTGSTVGTAGRGLKAQRFAMSGYPIQVGPTTHLAEERERLDAMTWQHFDVTRMCDHRCYPARPRPCHRSP